MRKTILTVAVVMFGCSLALGQAQEKILYSFSGPDGWKPLSKLLLDAEGNLYGTTEWGGSQGLGTVFQLSPGPNDTWTETVLYSFCQISDGGFCSDGMEPTAGLVADSAGNLYGTTAHGGGENCPAGDGGCGTIFELSPPMGPGEPWVYTLLYQFCQIPGDEQCSDGIFPYGKLTFDTTGNLYGTTQMGGTYAQGNVFKLSPGQNGWTETTLYSFCTLGKDPRCPDGRHPVSTLTLDRDGNIYGTTSEGGSAKYEGGGVVFKLSLGQNGWKETVLDAFPSGAGKRGGYLLGSVNFDSVGNLYSTAAQGGKFESGTVFRLVQTMAVLRLRFLSTVMMAFIRPQGCSLIQETALFTARLRPEGQTTIAVEDAAQFTKSTERARR